MTSVNAELFHREYDSHERGCEACGARTETQCECPRDDLAHLREFVRWHFGPWNVADVPAHLRGAFLRAFSANQITSEK